MEVPDSLPYTINLGVTSYTLTGYIDSVRIDTITGDPTGISSSSSPSLGTWLLPNQFSCAIFTGTTTAPTANYPLTISGRACGHFYLPAAVGGGTFDTCINYDFNRTYPYSLNVKNPAGISEISAGLNMNIYPNPNQGNFTVTISSASQLNGTMSIVDALGRTINTQNIDVTGTKQVPLEMSNLSPGAYLLVVNAGGARSAKQFIVK